jgi:hypothetical protein
VSIPPSDLPNIDADLFKVPAAAEFKKVCASHAPRMLLLYGSLRTRSFSKLLTLEAQRLLEALGAETRIYNPEGLPLPDGHPEDHPKVQELRALAAWSEGMVWTSPERWMRMITIPNQFAPYLVDRYSERRESASVVRRAPRITAMPPSSKVNAPAIDAGSSSGAEVVLTAVHTVQLEYWQGSL